MHRNVIAMMFTLLTLGVFVLVFLASKYGLAQHAWEADTTYFTAAILAVFAVGFMGVTRALLDCSYYFDRPEKASLTDLERTLEPLEWLAYVLSNLQWLALIWGLIGGISAASKMEVQGPEGAVRMAQEVFQHFSVALWPAIVSVVCYLVLQSYVVLLRYGHNRIKGRMG